MSIEGLRTRSKQQALWILTIFLSAVVCIIAYLIGTALYFDTKTLGISILGGLVAGIILIIFDLIMMQGLGYDASEENKKLLKDFKKLLDKK